MLTKSFSLKKDVATLEQNAVETATDEARQEGERDVRTAYNDFWWDRATTVVPTMRSSLVVAPTDGRIPPLTPEAQQRAEVEHLQPALRSSGAGGRGADSWLDRSLWERCISRGSPRLGSRAYNANVQIFQTPNHVVLLEEMVHEVRIIPLNGGAPLGGHVRQLLGDSRGHWDGETLVVETANFTDKTNFRGSANTLRTVERFTRTDGDTLLYEITFDDPSTWTQPWTAALPMPKSQGQIYKYACHEGNYGMTNLLSGARAEERDDAATTELR